MRISPEAKVGLTVIISLILLAAMTMAIGRIDFGQKEAIEIDVKYQSVDGLREGAPVRFAGVNVGKVSVIELLPYGVLVRIKFDRELIIPVDSQFVIANAGILGDKYIEIKPGLKQEPLVFGTEVIGVEPIAIDDLLGEVEGALRNLNYVVNSLTEFAESESLQENMAETGILLRETVAGLKKTVDQVNSITVSVQEVANHVEEFSQGLPSLQLNAMFKDLETFSKNLATLDISAINEITSELSKVPFKELASDLVRITNEIAAMDLASLEQDLRHFTASLAALDLTPLAEELTKITSEIASLGISDRAEEIARFTVKLDQLPLLEIADDLAVVTNSLINMPLTDIANNINTISRDLASVDIQEIVADLRLVTNELSKFGWQEMAANVNAFTQQLAAVDLEGLVAGLTQDLEKFSGNLAAIEFDYLAKQLHTAADNLVTLSQAVDASTVDRIIDDIYSVSDNIRAASIEVMEFASGFNSDISQVTEETLVIFHQIQAIASSIQYTIDSVNLFIDDMVGDGTTADSIKLTLSNIKESTDELTTVLQDITQEMSLNATMDDLKNTMTSIQKINADIQSLKGMSEKVDIESSWGVYYDIKGAHVFSPNVQFEFSPQELDSFYIIGWKDIGGRNLLQLQYGKEVGNVRQRYGLIDTKLGVGIDGQLADKWGLTAELSNITKKPVLSLQTRYQWWPDWWFGVRIDNVFGQDGINFGIEKKF